jgi:hypothetical protein
MAIYFINLLLILFWTIILKIINNKNRNAIIFILFIQLYLLLALRAPTVGVDTYGYINLFNRSKLFPFWEFGYSRHEWGYLFLNKILSFVDSEQVFVAILAFIPLYIFFKFISRESKMPWLSIYLFITLGFYTNTFNLLRQVIAISIITISYKYLKENNLKKFCIWVIIASLFHISALAFLPIYFVRNNKLNYKSMCIYSSIGLFLIIFGNKIISIIINRFSSIEYQIKSNGGFIMLAVLISTLILGLFFSKSVLSKNDRSIVLYNILIFAILTQVLALDFALFTRVTSYFRVFLIILIPEVIYYIKDRNIRVIGVFLVVCLTAIQYYMTLKADLSGIVPYYFFINNSF